MTAQSKEKILGIQLMSVQLQANPSLRETHR